jgi:uncharacterized protein (DUF427 family)
MSDRELSPEQKRWREHPRTRPHSIPVAGPGQESVWSYPRPPRIESVRARVRVEFAGLCIADSTRVVRVVETSSPPCYYIPPEDVRRDLLRAEAGRAFCEWKGHSNYWSLVGGGRESRDAAWSYPEPEPEYVALRDFVAFHAGRVDTCSVGGAPVTPQPGDYYGGWITPDLVGPFKGAPGSENW